MPSPGHTVVDQYRSIPDNLPFTLRTRQWPGSIRLLILPIAFLLAPVVTQVRDDPLPSYWWLIAGMGVCLFLTTLILLWLRRGPDFGMSDTGVWLRPSMLSRRTRFVPFHQLEHIEWKPHCELRDHVVGVKLWLHTRDGPLPRRPRFVPCRQSGIDELAAAMASAAGRIPRPGGRHDVAEPTDAPDTFFGHRTR